MFLGRNIDPYARIRGQKLVQNEAHSAGEIIALLAYRLRNATVCSEGKLRQH